MDVIVFKDLSCARAGFIFIFSWDGGDPGGLGDSRSGQVDRKMISTAFFALSLPNPLSSTA